MMFIILYGCSERYILNIKTIPKGEYSISVDQQNYGNTSLSGDTTIVTEKISLFKKSRLELKSTDGYGFIQMSGEETFLKKLNVYSFNVRSPRNYSITFLFDVDKVPRPFTEKDICQKNKCYSFNFSKKCKLPKVLYCIIGNDTNSYSYFGLKRHVDYYLDSNRYSWTQADVNLQKAITEYSFKSFNDSLSPEIFMDAALQNVKYLVLFYGFSINDAKGVSPATVGASIAITTLGTILGSQTGLFIFAFPNGQDEITNPTVCCAIFSVNPNRCIFKAKESLTSYNKTDIRGQINNVVESMFKKIDVIIPKEGVKP